MSSEPGISYRDVFDAVLARSVDSVVLCSADGRYVALSDSFCALTGYSRDELLGHTSVELGLVDPAGPRRVAEADVAAGRGGLYRNLLHRADGTTRHVEFSHQLLPDGSQIVIVRDITARVLAEYMIGEPATTDRVTGLPHRRAFTARAGRLITDAMPPVHLVLAELPRSDGTDHGAVDRAMRALAHALRDALTDFPHPSALGLIEDRVAAALLGGGSPQDASRLAAAVQARIADPSGRHGNVRFGIATQAGRNLSLEGLLTQARAALGQEPAAGIRPRARPSSAPASGPSPRG